MDYTAFIGFALPPFIDLLNRKVVNSKVRFTISLLVCLLVGVLINIPNLKVGDVTEVLGSFAVVFTTAQITYATYWKTSNARTLLMK